MGERTLPYMLWQWLLVQSIVLQLMLRESYICGDAMRNHSVVTVRPNCAFLKIPLMILLSQAAMNPPYSPLLSQLSPLFSSK